MECIFCKKSCYKRGKRNGIQRYQCKHCKKYQQENYTRARIPLYKLHWVHILNNEGCSISSVGRILTITKSSVQRLIENLTQTLPKPVFTEHGQSYEIDELKTFCGSKKQETWVIYAINKRTRQIVSFWVGRRTKENVGKVIKELLELAPKHIYTDRLNIYGSLIPKEIHKYYPKCTNHIERKNLTLRTHLKRLNRKTICFTRSETMLYNVLHLWMYNDPFVKMAA